MDNVTIISKNVKVTPVSNSFFNRLFKTKKINESIIDMAINQHIIDRTQYWMQQLDACQHLGELMRVHKKMWRDGFNHPNIGPDEYGMYRTKDINTMTIDDVYLGGVYGLNTNNITFWENRGDDPYNESASCYDVVFNQYYNHLMKNVQYMFCLAEKNMTTYIGLGY